MIHCRKTRQSFRRWPWPGERPRSRPETPRECRQYLKELLAKPGAFAKFLKVTGYFTTQNPYNHRARRKKTARLARNLARCPRSPLRAASPLKTLLLLSFCYSFLCFPNFLLLLLAAAAALSLLAAAIASTTLGKSRWLSQVLHLVLVTLGANAPGTARIRRRGMARHGGLNAADTPTGFVCHWILYIVTQRAPSPLGGHGRTDSQHAPMA